MNRIFFASSIFLLACLSQNAFSGSVGGDAASARESSFSSDVFKDVRLQFVMPHTLNQSIKVPGKLVPASGESGDLWAEFHIVPSKQNTVSSGQTVFVQAVGDTKNSSIYRRKIDVVTAPSTDRSYQIAKTKIHGSSVNTPFLSGQNIEGKIVTSEFRVDIAVEKSAIQEMGGKKGVFILKDKKFEFAPLALGREGDIFVEVISGVEIKTVYATENASLIKAEFEAVSSN